MTHEHGTQDEVVRALSGARFYPHAPVSVEHVQTHISHVFLAGPYVYKLKKAVRFPFLDFSTLERRRFFCDEEIRHNRRLAPAVYLDVLPIARDGAGGLVLGGRGEVVDYVVWMRRLPADRILARLLDCNAVSIEMIERLVAVLARFHAQAPTGPEVVAHAAPEALRATWEQTLGLATPLVGSLLDVEGHAILADFGPTFIHRHEALLRARQAAGRIREGHGDLHAEHICFVERPVPAPGMPALGPGVYIFDCIEFSAAFRCTDVAAEIAFTAMDLTRLGHPELARAFVERYVAATGDPEVRALLPLYACYRACVRGAVEGLKTAEADVPPAERAAAAQRARSDFAVALRYAWAGEGPALVACAGLSGTGKSALAAPLADTTGFVLLSSDVIRKRDAGLDATTPTEPSRTAALYTAAAREAVYTTLCAEAEAALAEGRGVVADATFIRRADRARLAAVAARQRCRHVFLECQTDERRIRARLAERRGSVSDARWETYLMQRRELQPFGADEPRIVVETSAPPESLVADVLRRLWRWYEHGELETARLRTS